MKNSEAHCRSFLKKNDFGEAGLLIAAAGGVVYRAWGQGALGSNYGGPAFPPRNEIALRGV